jgi:excisionase family DNA binding protein
MYCIHCRQFNEMSSMFSIPQAAKILKMHRTRIWRLVKEKRIEALEVPGGSRSEYRITQEAIDKFLKNHSNKSGRRKKEKPLSKKHIKPHTDPPSIT